LAEVTLRLPGIGESEEKTIVAILPDSGERYLGGPLFEGLFDESGLPRI
jgi:cysteine synthase A